ncbi:PTS sugar transporter subunit IIA [Candidatus Sumerlaeota bacterium]|nr:PTS sugar transporter subunit IIA [Candidatus Sumerlaeota bacterium]
MKLAALIEEKNVLIHMEWRTLAEAVRALVESLGPSLGRLSPDVVCEQLMAVEENLAVTPGHGVRMPHARLKGIDRLLMAVGTSKEGILVGTETDERVSLIFLILTPKTESATMLQTMASIARFVHGEENRKALVSTTAAARALRILEESGIEVKKALVAGDLMSAPTASIPPDMTLRQAVGLLAQSREEGLAVVDDEGQILGEISAGELMELGLPKYMNLVTNSKVLTEFQPFEAFYRREDSMTASELMNRDLLILPPETPVEILAHELLTKNRHRAYIAREQHLLGVVHRRDIVRKVLFL